MTMERNFDFKKIVHIKKILCQVSFFSLLGEDNNTISYPTGNFALKL